MDIDKNDDKMNNKFYCVVCDYLACDKYNYTRHLSTIKHKRFIFQNKEKETNEENEDFIKIDKNNETFVIKKKSKKYNCICGKKYKHQPNLIRHKKTCKFKENTNKVCVNHEELIIMLVNENNELKKQIIELLNK